MSDVPVTSAPPIPTGAPPAAPPPAAEPAAPPAAPPTPETPPPAPVVEWDPTEGVAEIKRLREENARYRGRYQDVLGDVPDEAVEQIRTLTDAIREGDGDAVRRWLWESAAANTPQDQWAQVAAQYGPAAATAAVPGAPQAQTTPLEQAQAAQQATQDAYLTPDQARALFREVIAEQQHDAKVAEFGSRMQGELAQLGLPQHSPAWNGTLAFASMLSQHRGGEYVTMQEGYQAWWAVEGHKQQQTQPTAPPPGNGAAVAPNGQAGAPAVPDRLEGESIGDAARRKAMARMTQQRGQGGAFG